jgi:hypothetical protein
MTTTSASALTPKQQHVFNLISEGVTPAAIAKQMKISPSGVYGHMRHIRQAGVTLPIGSSQEAAPPQATSTPAFTSSNTSHANGTVEPSEALGAAVSQGEARVEEIDDELVGLRAQIDGLETERSSTEERIAKFKGALAALA